MLAPERYIEVIRDTQLVSVDLIVTGPEGRVLLGKRVNEPAQGFFFVPGSRIYKNEPLRKGCLRVLKDELGLGTVQVNHMRFLGVYEHMYPTNFLKRKDIGTHYVVMAMRVVLFDPEDVDLRVFAQQHSTVAWMTVEELKKREDVHPLTKAYFQNDASNCFFKVR